MKFRIVYEATDFKTIVVDGKSITIIDGDIIVDQGDKITKIQANYGSYIRIEAV